IRAVPVTGVQTLCSSDLRAHARSQGPTLGQARLDRLAHEACELRAATLEIEHELGLAMGGGEEIGQEQMPPERRSELPAVPVERGRKRVGEGKAEAGEAG